MMAQEGQQTGAKRLIIVGAGGHAKVVADVALTAGFDVLGFADDERKEAPLPGFRVLCGVGELASTVQGLDDVYAVIAVGDNAIRKRIAERLRNGGIALATVVHPSSCVSQFAWLGLGTVIMPGVVVNAGARIGDHVILNTSCSIDHDCTIADFVHISPGAHLAGSVSVGEGVHVGIGAAIIPGKCVREWSVVGAGAVVVKDVPPGVVVAGVPAREIRRIQNPASPAGSNHGGEAPPE